MPETPDSPDSDMSLRSRMIEIGLADPFIRVIVGMVVIALAASFAVSIMGGALQAVFAVGLSVMFGVVLAVLRVLMKHLDDKVVWTMCLVASGVIILVFLSLIVIAVPAVTICWPSSYSQTLRLKGCAASPQSDGGPYKERPYTGKGIALDPANGRYEIRIYFRPSRKTDAEYVGGALLMAGFKSEGIESSLDEVDAPDRSPGTSLIKTTPDAQPIAAELDRITKLAVPLDAARVNLWPNPVALQKGAAQIDLF